MESSLAGSESFRLSGSGSTVRTVFFLRAAFLPVEARQGKRNAKRTCGGSVPTGGISIDQDLCAGGLFTTRLELLAACNHE